MNPLPPPAGPTPFDPATLRYTTVDFPPYRHVPGLTPHPRRHPLGHQFGAPEGVSPPFLSSDWQRSHDYLYGVDLYNFSFFWEAHESWELIWKTTAPDSLSRIFLHGLIQVAAALLKRAQGQTAGMKSLALRALPKLHRVCESEPVFCGVDLREYLVRIETLFATAAGGPEWPVDPRLRLALE